MSIREDIEEVENKIKHIEQGTYAMEILTDYKRTNKRLFIILVMVLIMWFLTIGYLIYILNDINSNTIAIEDINTIDNSTIKNGDNLWETLK